MSVFSMRSSFLRAAVPALAALPVFAAQARAESVNLLDPKAGLMFWTLVIFVLLFVVLSKFAFRPLFAAVEGREKALEEAIEGAKRDRAEAEALLAQQKAQLESARNEAQAIIAEGRATAEKMRGELIAQTKHQQEEMIEQARRAIDSEKKSAIADLRREAIDLAIAGASRVIEQNLDSSANRKIVESFLSSLDSKAVS